jgi:hypothetical protein
MMDEAFCTPLCNLQARLFEPVQNTYVMLVELKHAILMHM